MRTEIKPSDRYFIVSYYEKADEYILWGFPSLREVRENTVYKLDVGMWKVKYLDLLID